MTEPAILTQTPRTGNATEPRASLNPAAHPDSKYLHQPGEINTCLKQLRDRRLTLTLCVTGTGNTYRCRMLDVSDHDFLIEDISPRTGIQALRNAPGFSMSARAESTYVYIDSTHVLAWGQEQGKPYFHVALPDKMLYQQRRRDTRFQIPLRVSANGATVTLSRSGKMIGRVIDLSVGGCRAVFDLPTPWPMQTEARFENCAINLPDLFEIHSEIVVRHFHENSTNLICGMELTRMHVADRRRLEQFIQLLGNSA